MNPSSLRLKTPVSEENTSQLPSTLKLKKPTEEIKQKESFKDSDFISDEQVEKDIERAQARTLSRVGETILGAPGDIASFFTGLFGKDQNVLPTSSGIKKFTEKASQGYLSPQSEFEERSDELVSDIASMAIPGSGKYNFARNIGIPVVANLVKEGLKYGNSSEKSQAYGKIGSMVALDLLSRRTGGAKKYASSLFGEAEKSLPNGLSFDASNLKSSLDKLENTLSSGGSRPTTKKALEKVSEIKSEIKNGKIDAKKLAAYRPSINEAIEELGGFQMEVPRKLKPKAIKNLNEVKSEVIKTLDEYGKKFNPKFLELNRSANEAWAAYEKSNKIANFLQNKVPYSPKSKAVQALFSIAPSSAVLGLASISPASALGAVTGLTAYQGYKVLDRVTRSPVLRKYYLNTLKEASLGNIPQTSKNLKALDLSLKDENYK